MSSFNVYDGYGRYMVLAAREKAIADWDRQMEVEEIERRIRERVQREDLERRKEREREKARLVRYCYQYFRQTS